MIGYCCTNIELSFVDIMFIGRIMPKHAAIMAKKELKWIPGLGWFSQSFN